MSAIKLRDLQEVLGLVEQIEPRLNGDLDTAQVCVFPYHVLIVHPDGSTDELRLNEDDSITLNPNTANEETFS